MEELHPKRLLSKIAFAFVEFSRIQVTTNDLKRKAAADNVGLMLCDSELHLLSELANIAQQTIEAFPIALFAIRRYLRFGTRQVGT